MFTDMSSIINSGGGGAYSQVYSNFTANTSKTVTELEEARIIWLLCIIPQVAGCQIQDLMLLLHQVIH